MADAFDRAWDISKNEVDWDNYERGRWPAFLSDKEEDWPLGPQQEEGAYNEQQLITAILSHVMDLHRSEDPSELDHLMWLGQELKRAQQPNSQPPHEDWNKELADDDPMQDAPRDLDMGNRYIPPMMLPRSSRLSQLMQMLQENPMVWAETGTGPEGAYTNLMRERPNEAEMFHRWNTDEWAEEGWTPMDQEGPFDDKLWMTRHDEKKPWGEGGFDFHDHDSDERGSVGQIDLVEALMRLINEGKSHL